MESTQKEDGWVVVVDEIGLRDTLAEQTMTIEEAAWCDTRTRERERVRDEAQVESEIQHLRTPRCTTRKLYHKSFKRKHSHLLQHIARRCAKDERVENRFLALVGKVPIELQRRLSHHPLHQRRAAYHTKQLRRARGLRCEVRTVEHLNRPESYIS